MTALWLALKLFGGRVFALASRIPWKVWVGIALLLALGWHLHKDKVHVSDARKAGDKAGYIRAMHEVEIKALALATHADAVSRTIRSQNDEKNRIIAARADDLRLRGPGAAHCTYTVPSSSPSGRVAAGRPGDAPATTVPATDWAAVPWGWVVGQAERCDANRAEVLSWREWRGKLATPNH